jgi:heterodisulfide reductase subunit C
LFSKYSTIYLSFDINKMKMKIFANGEFAKRIEELSGQNIFSCYQCGKCSAGCPILPAMDIIPNQIIRLIQLGKKDEVLSSKTPWLCASCLTCSVRCPKGIDLARIMESLRITNLQAKGDFLKLSGFSEKLLLELPQQALVSSFRKFTY